MQEKWVGLLTSHACISHIVAAPGHSAPPHPMAEPLLHSLFRFGSHVIPRGQVFLATRLSFAFTNRKPILPGHVLVSTRRVVKRFEDLLPDEVADLFLCAHRVGPVVQRVFGGTSLTISMQDGPDAGQTVEHVHLHLIPRQPGDFQKNDDIYQELENHDTTKKEDNGFRSLEEMEREARHLATFFPSQ